MAKTIFSGIKNSEIFTLCQAFSPQFKNLTANYTADKLDAGWEANKNFDPTVVNEWFNISMKIILQKVDIATVKNPIEGYGLVENYLDEWGNAAQRIAVSGMKPVDPKFHGLSNGDSVDHYIVRKPNIEERFFTQNFDFQNFFTLQDFQIKQILQSEFGMDQITSGIMQQMENSYQKQRYVNELEALSAGMNSSDFPLQATQKVNVASWTDAGITDAELLGFIQDVKNTVDAMVLAPATSAYNAGGFETAISADDLVLLVRPALLTAIQTRLMVGAYNKEDLTLPIAVKPLLNFGGQIPYYMNAGVKTYLYPVFNSLGEQIGWNTSEDQTTVVVENGAELYEDRNENVLGVILQKGAIFTTQQNGVQMIPTPINARGVYTNYFFNVINAGVHFDYFYNMVLICKPDTPLEYNAKGDGTEKNFVIDNPVREIIVVKVDGTETSAYTFDDDTNKITFTTAPANNKDVYVKYYAYSES